jgi:hypothetical protein
MARKIIEDDLRADLVALAVASNATVGAYSSADERDFDPVYEPDSLHDHPCGTQGGAHSVEADLLPADRNKGVVRN